MKNYQGVTKDDSPYGAGSHVKENQDGGEMANFYPLNNKYYGYVRISRGGNLNINKLGASRHDDFIKNVTIVFFATNPFTKGQYVVGWYENATLYRLMQELKSTRKKGYASYLAVCNTRNARLLSVPLRKLEVPKDSPGQSNVWYVANYYKADSFLAKFGKFKRNPEIYSSSRVKKESSNKRWQLDLAKRLKVEKAAMKATANYFIVRGFEIKEVHLDKVGWDMEAQKGNLKFKLEIKGTSNNLQAVELTANEYIHSTKHINYRVCIDENALNQKKAKLHICQLKNKYWISELGDKLKIIEVKSAQLRKVE